MKHPMIATALSTTLALVAPVHGADLTVKVLPSAEDPGKKTVLIGRSVAGGMVVTFELEPAKGMWMAMDGKWIEHPVAEGERYHVEVKPEDPKSKTRLPYADVTYSALNRDNGRTVSGSLHPMWGGSGLHYATNSPLAGDGTYEVTVTVGVPRFGRAPADKDRWMTPVTTHFHFKLAGGKVVEVTVPAPAL